MVQISLSITVAPLQQRWLLRMNSTSCVANRHWPISADLATDPGIDDLAEQACNAFGGLHILVNNASSFYPTRFGDIDRRAWDDLIASNYRAPLFLAQACYPSLQHNHGCIINMLDIYASRPLNQHSVYCSAKAANRSLVESLALELAPEVRVNGIAPGAILWPEKTGMMLRIANNNGNCCSGYR